MTDGLRIVITDFGMTRELKENQDSNKTTSTIGPVTLTFIVNCFRALNKIHTDEARMTYLKLIFFAFRLDGW